MCGIAGWFHRHSDDEPIGTVMQRMLAALGRRGPDSAGVALFGRGEPEGEICWVKLPDDMPPAEGEALALRRLAASGRTISHRRVGGLVRAVIARDASITELCERVEREGFEVISIGRRLELVKQVGDPAGLERTFGVSAVHGSHAIGHTRLSTESKVDLSHSQPFWARGVADLATVHNGHITNYDRLRRRYEQRGHRFFTHNDSEVIAVYIADHLAAGMAFDEVLRASLDDLDGSFTYLAATADEFGYARDPFALKPLITVETEDVVAIANEEIAIREILGQVGVAHEPSGHVSRVWRRARATAAVVA